MAHPYHCYYDVNYHVDKDDVDDYDCDVVDGDDDENVDVADEMDDFD